MGSTKRERTPEEDADRRARKREYNARRRAWLLAHPEELERARAAARDVTKRYRERHGERARLQARERLRARTSADPSWRSRLREHRRGTAEDEQLRREQERERGRVRYAKKRAWLLEHPEELAKHRANGREEVRRYRERNRERLLAWRREDRIRRRDDPAWRERQREVSRASIERNREKVYERNRAYSRAHREQRSASDKRRRERDRERILQANRERNRRDYEQRRDEILAYNREWRRRNPDRARAYVRAAVHKRRAAAGAGSWTYEQWAALVETYAGRCAYCGAEAKLHADHRMPLVRGGSNTIDNIVPACRSCNSRKNKKTEEEFRAYLATRPPWPFKTA